MAGNCPYCGAEDYGTPSCPSCGTPRIREEKAGPPVIPGTASEAGDITERLASIPARFFAIVIDEIILLIIAVILTLLSGLAYDFGSGSLQTGFWNLGMSPGFHLTYIFLWLVYHTAYLGSTGQTPGKKKLGIRVVTTGGEKLSYSRALGRTLGYFFSSFFYLGFLWAIWDRKKQAWHDKLVDTMVVRT